MRATHLQVEYLIEPLGLGNPKPRFYWNCEGGIRQTAYQIICKRGNEIVWDSGKVASSSMTHIRYAGQPLRSRDAVTWSVQLWDENGEPGEIVVSTKKGKPCGLFMGYYKDAEATAKVWHDGWYHTGDQAWRDEDGFLWYIGRVDDVIKSSGYRIGPFEIESVIMELPYVLECGVSPEPDPVRGQVVKASVVLTKGTEPSEALKKEIQTYVKEHTAPYKYPRIVVFRDSLPKTISGKIQRNLL